MKILSHISEFEELLGRKMTPGAIRFIEKLDILGKKFEDKGREDAANTHPAMSDNVFMEYCRKIFDDDPELTESIAALMQICYMDGYNGKSDAE